MELRIRSYYTLTRLLTEWMGKKTGHGIATIRDRRFCFPSFIQSFFGYLESRDFL